MAKIIVFVIAGAVGFLVAFGWTAKDEIAAEVVKRSAADFTEKCVRQMGRQGGAGINAQGVCGCMKSAFDAKGLTMSDAFGEHRGEMQAITKSCMARYR